MDNSPLPPTTTSSLQRAMTRRLLRRSVATGEISLPAVPGMLEEYVTMCANLFGALGSEFSDDATRWRWPGAATQSTWWR